MEAEETSVLNNINLNSDSIDTGKPFHVDHNNKRYATLKNVELSRGAFEALLPVIQNFSNRKPRELIVSPQDQFYAQDILHEYKSFLPQGYRINRFLIEQSWYVVFSE